MMENNDKYKKVVKVLKGQRPALENKENLTDQIMARIREPEDQTKPSQLNLSHYLFGWADVPWFRRAMTVAATVLVGIFIIQQVVITDRINSLEKQLVKTVSTIQIRQPDLGIMQKVLLNVVTKDQIEEDSITISRSDLEELMDSYLELKKEYDEMRENRRVESFIQKKIRQNLKKKNNNSESEFEL